MQYTLYCIILNNFNCIQSTICHAHKSPNLDYAIHQNKSRGEKLAIRFSKKHEKLIISLISMGIVMLWSNLEKGISSIPIQHW